MFGDLDAPLNIPNGIEIFGNLGAVARTKSADKIARRFLPIFEVYGELRGDLRRRFQEGQGKQADLDQANIYDAAYNACASLPPP